MESKPTLVVGATGKVGRLVVEELLAQGHSVHALVRNQTKAAEVLPAPSSTLPIMGIGTDAASLEPSVAVPALCGDDCSDAPSSSAATTTEGAASCGRLSLFHGDVNDEASLRAAMEGCGAVISVAGTFRLTKPGDLLPWRFFGNDCMAWCADVKHPYFVNFVGTRRLVKLAEELQVRKKEKGGGNKREERRIHGLIGLKCYLKMPACSCSYSTDVSVLATCIRIRLHPSYGYTPD